MKTPLAILLITVLVSKEPLTVTSPEFKEGEMIPVEFTCMGANVNPELNIDGLPANTESLAIIMDDPDAPKGTFVHWVIWNIPAQNKIEEHTAPGMQGVNSKQENSYTGPCPPSGTHRYYFKVYALDSKLTLPSTSGKEELLNAMKGHILASGELMGRFKK
jgi:Raf kinase inhibitor-like YbhB/YbcL family protein